MSHDNGSCEEGWKVIFENHCAQPRTSDVEDFRLLFRQHDTLAELPTHRIQLSLQLSNFDFSAAASLLLDQKSPFGWKPSRSQLAPCSLEASEDDNRNDVSDDIVTMEEQAAREIFNILDQGGGVASAHHVWWLEGLDRWGIGHEWTLFAMFSHCRLYRTQW